MDKVDSLCLDPSNMFFFRGGGGGGGLQAEVSKESSYKVYSKAVNLRVMKKKILLFENSKVFRKHNNL